MEPTSGMDLWLIKRLQSRGVSGTLQDRLPCGSDSLPCSSHSGTAGPFNKAAGSQSNMAIGRALEEGAGSPSCVVPAGRGGEQDPKRISMETRFK